MKKSSYSSPRASAHRLKRQQSSHSGKIYYEDSHDGDNYLLQRALSNKFPIQQNYFRNTVDSGLAYDPYDDVSNIYIYIILITKQMFI